MAYLPGVPDLGPAPVSPTAAVTAHSHNAGVGRGASTPIGRLARSVGKPGRTESLGTVVGRRSSGITSIGGGVAALHSMGHYGKASPMLGGANFATAIDPTANPASRTIRGGSGGVKTHGYLKFGGLGPGRAGSPGPSNTDYSMANNMDTE